MPHQASTSASDAARVASTVLVAATLRSGPAPMSMTALQASASGEAASFTRARQNAPSVRAISVCASRSGLLPDCEMAMNNAPANRWWTP